MEIKRKYKVTFRRYKPAFTNDLWNLDLSSLDGIRSKFFRFIKLIRITFDSFAEHRMGFQCVALSYFGTLALIPMCAFIFSVSKGLGIAERLSEWLISYPQISPELLNLIFDKAKNIINTAQSGAVGIISALMFFWTIIWMFFQVERVFNNAWGLRKIDRKIYKRFSFYLVMLVMLPFIIAIFSAGIVLYSNLLENIGLDMTKFAFFRTFLSWLLFGVITTFIISAMYKFIPQPKIQYKYALKAAIVSGIAFTLFQYCYLETQMFVARLNAVYGVLAAIPLFMIWMNLSWQIIMYGAELVYAYHHQHDYNLDQ